MKIFYTNHAGERGHCSGSVLLSGVILTAGHCIYSNATQDGDGIVGYYAPNTIYVVPDNRWINAQQTSPYGYWTARRTWTTNAYANGVLGADWGLIEVLPNAAGQYPGAIVGEVNAVWNHAVPYNAHMYLTGYPISGQFGLPQYGVGNHQAYCNVTRQGEISNHPSFGNFVGINAGGCFMTGGASGGPQFIERQDGTWAVVAVNNRGEMTAEGVGANMIGFHLDQDFGDFYNAVVALIAAG